MVSGAGVWGAEYGDGVEADEEVEGDEAEAGFA